MYFAADAQKYLLTSLVHAARPTSNRVFNSPVSSPTQPFSKYAHSHTRERGRSHNTCLPVVTLRLTLIAMCILQDLSTHVYTNVWRQSMPTLRIKESCLARSPIRKLFPGLFSSSSTFTVFNLFCTENWSWVSFHFKHADLFMRLYS